MPRLPSPSQLALILATVVCIGARPASAQQARYSLRTLLAEGRLRVVDRNASALGDAARDGIHVDERVDDGLVWLTGVDLDDGTIDVDLRGRDVLQRSFIGLAFHGSLDGSFDAVYLRPFNFRATDPVRHRHAIQYVALPAYGFQRLRDEQPDRFENPVLPEPEATAWTHLRVVVRGDSVHAFVNGAAAPALSVPRLRSARGGAVGLWVGTNSDGDFADLRITPSPRH